MVHINQPAHDQSCTCRYVWNAAGSIMVALPQLYKVNSTVSERAMSYTENSKLLTDAADAIERLLSAQKEVGTLHLFRCRSNTRHHPQRTPGEPGSPFVTCHTA